MPVLTQKQIKISDMEDKKTETIKSLPHDVVIEILSWLPAKFLWPFRCVSKSWLHLLTKDLQFSHLHFHRTIKLNTNNPSILIPRPGHYEKTFFYMVAEYISCNKAVPLILPVLGRSIIMGICHGMVCLIPHEGSEVYIWNPITDDKVSIPFTPSSHFPDSYRGNPGFGFGFHQDSNQYKLIKVFRCSEYGGNDHAQQVSVYTLGVDTAWRPIDKDHPYKLETSREPYPLVSGAIHWLADGKKGTLLSPLIVALDLKDEIFREILPPKVGECGDTLPCEEIKEFGGFLGYFLVLPYNSVQIWLMHEYGEINSWTKQFTVGIPEVSGDFCRLDPLGLLNSKEIIIQKNQWEMIVYNGETNSIRTLESFEFVVSRPYVYIGSIMSPTLISNNYHIPKKYGREVAAKTGLWLRWMNCFSKVFKVGDTH